MNAVELEGRTFLLKEAGEVTVIGTDGFKVSYYTGSVVTRDDLYMWALGFTSAKDVAGWGGLV